MGPNFFTCSGLGWVSQNGPMDNSELCHASPPQTWGGAPRTSVIRDYRLVILFLCVSVCLLFSIDDAGLRHIIYHHGSNRKEVYKRLFAILWFGNSIGKTSVSCDKSPTYVFPEDVRAEVRRRFPSQDQGSHDDQYQGDASAYVVTWDEMRAAKWPRPPKACCLCSRSYKPY